MTFDMETETQELIDDVVVTQEEILETEVPQEEEVRVDPQEPVDEAIVTQESIAEVEKIES